MAKRTITVPASSLVDRVLAILSESFPQRLPSGIVHVRARNRGDRLNKTRACLSSLRRLAVVDGGQDIPCVAHWQTRQPLSRTVLPDGRVQWTAEVDA